jgi:hypothetical protein
VWSKGGSGASRIIEVGDTIPVNTPVLTIVDMNNLQLRCDIDQRQMMTLKAGMACKTIFNEQSGMSVDGKITEIGQIPLDDGKFDCLIQLDKIPAGLVPGMNCKVKIVAYSNPKAILIPKTAVFSDDGGLTQYVYIDKDSGPEKRTVVALRASGESLEVTDGLQEGENILATKPE